jgi:hypothetical protein
MDIIEKEIRYNNAFLFDRDKNNDCSHRRDDAK